jgi:hypothetical protein
MQSTDEQDIPVCVVCNHPIGSDRYVPVMTQTGAGVVHRDCFDTWVSWNR